MRETRLQWTVEKDGEYVGDARFDTTGVYEIRVEARRNGKTLGEDIVHLRVAPQPFEFRNPEMKKATLERIAAETGGRFYTRETVSRMPDDLTYSPRTASVVNERELWDMPALFLAILLPLMIEWSYRKYRGLV